MGMTVAKDCWRYGSEVGVTNRGTDIPVCTQKKNRKSRRLIEVPMKTTRARYIGVCYSEPKRRMLAYVRLNQTMHFFTDEVVRDARRHDDQTDEQIGYSQRHEEIVGHVTQLALHCDCATDESVSGDTSRDENEQQ